MAMDAVQENNDVSPWDLCKRFPSVPLVEPTAFTADPPASPAALLEHLLTTEPAALFLALPTEAEAPLYRARVKAPTTLPALLAKAHGGGYEGKAWGGGLNDLRALINNAKNYYQHDTLEWRCADALEAEVSRVVKAHVLREASAAAAAAAKAAKMEVESGGGGGES
jgi:hypothetical protein